MSITAHPEQAAVLHVTSPLGVLTVQCQSGRVLRLDISTKKVTASPLADPATKQIAVALQHYFAAGDYCFRLPLQLQGTPYQRRVWRALQKIPAGQTRTYGDLARQLHSSPRAVGMACRANPIPVIIPCHRVVAATGLGGYAGKTAGRQLDIKRWLLAHEGIQFD